MKDVLLIHPPICFREGKPHIALHDCPPMGLIYLKSHIERHAKDYRVTWMDPGGYNLDLDEVRRQIAALNPWVVGFTLETAQLQGAIEIAAIVRELFPKVPIFGGGHHVTADPEFITRNRDYFDYGITGEGEHVLLETLDKLARGEELPTIQAGRPLLDLDFPVEDLWQHRRENYWKCQHIHGTRSCPYKCYFCSAPAENQYGKMRYASNKRLIDEIKYNYDYYKGRIKFLDENWTLDRDRTLEFCHMVRKEGLRLRYFCQTRVDYVDEELLREMKATGLLEIAFGIENGNERFRTNNLNKGGRNKCGVTNDMVYQVDEWCRKLDIGMSAYFIFGYPGETKQTVQDSYDMIFNLKLEKLSLGMPSPFPGVPLFDMAKAEGLISYDLIDRYARKEFGEGFWGVYPVYVSRDLDVEYCASVISEIYRKFYLNLATVQKRLKRALITSDELWTDAQYFWSLFTKGASYRRDFTGYAEVAKKSAPWQPLTPAP